MFQAQSLRKQYYPSTPNDIDTNTTNSFWWHIIAYTAGIIMAAIGFWYFGYWDDFSGRPDDGSAAPRNIPLPETPIERQGDTTSTSGLDPSGSTSIRKLSDVGSSSSSSSSGSLTPTWENPGAQKEFNHYFVKPTVEKSPLENKRILDAQELTTFGDDTSSWAATPKDSNNNTFSRTLPNKFVDSRPFNTSISTSGSTGFSTSVDIKGKNKVDSDIYPGCFPGRFPPKTR